MEFVDTVIRLDNLPLEFELEQIQILLENGYGYCVMNGTKNENDIFQDSPESDLLHHATYYSLLNWPHIIFCKYPVAFSFR